MVLALKGSTVRGFASRWAGLYDWKNHSILCGDHFHAQALCLYQTNTKVQCFFRQPRVLYENIMPTEGIRGFSRNSNQLAHIAPRAMSKILGN
jgi:hypothetical protein